MSVHAFVDESRRNDTYLPAVAMVSPGQLNKLRKLLMGLRMPNQRELHFKKETPARRKQILSALVPAVVHVNVYVAWCYGAGGDWFRRARPLMGDVIDTRKP